MHHLSQRKRSRCLMRPPKPTTVMLSDVLSLTSILAFTPLLFNASIRRFAATAAPPVISLVLTIRTRIDVLYDSLANLHIFI